MGMIQRPQDGQLSVESNGESVEVWPVGQHGGPAALRSVRRGRSRPESQRGRPNDLHTMRSCASFGTRPASARRGPADHVDANPA
jgi:hypothetical protein